jgi:hypothetical protein
MNKILKSIFEIKNSSLYSEDYYYKIKGILKYKDTDNNYNQFELTEFLEYFKNNRLIDYINSKLEEVKTDYLYPSATHGINHNIRVMLYSVFYRDCRPRCLETRALQKGLVLLWNGHELIEEGVGFGVPVVKYTDKTFFSGNAQVSIQKNGSEWTLTKAFALDMVSIKKFGNASYIDDKAYSIVRKKFQMLYLKHRNLNSLFNKIMEMRELLNIKTEFLTVKPRGTIVVTYRCQPKGITIHADFTRIKQNGCQEVLLLNEQGSSYFQKYADSRGEILVGNKIGPWDKIDAEEASLQSSQGYLKFSLQKFDGAQLFRGYERTRKRFSWVGLSYTVPPCRRVFEYSVALSYHGK